ncbi:MULTISPECIES: hypothetical protein [unclassified Brevundimonas]|uniref:hypothetical protein n=1 Tax=unclassified Brevundimonas TaxID=2622653 RepID=UPI000A7EB265|nr:MULTISPECIES: hypothetical protein [unclassified Brevundimonas]
MSIQVKLDEGLCRAWVTVLPEPQTSTVAETVLQLTDQRPVLGSWDWIIDIRNPHAQATPEEIESISAAFNAVTSQQSYTIFISHDPATYDRCALMARTFLRRRHLVARSVAEAKALLPMSVHRI